MGVVTNPDGSKRPGTPKKRSGGVAVAALVLGLGLAAGGAGTGLSLGGDGASASSSSKASSNGRAKDRSTSQVERRLARAGLKITSRVSASDDCAAHSYGQVQAFFHDQPCDALFRASFEVRDARRNVVLVAVAWVDMPDAARAARFQRLVDRPGTGNVTELSRERGTYRNVRFDGTHYDSARDGITVVNSQAQPAGRTAGAIALAGIVSTALR